MQQQSLFPTRQRHQCITNALAMLLSMGFVFSATAGNIPDAVAMQIRAGIAANTVGQVKVDQISETPVRRIYEVISQGEIFYVDETGRYSFVGGSLVDTKHRKDLTSESQEKVFAIPFDKLPLKHAIKEVHGDGSRVMAVFEDPNCPICRVFTKFVDQIENVTIYRFMLPIISPQSQSLARMAWCSADRGGVWKAMMDGARPRLNESCDVQGLVQILKTAEHYSINNTPTVVLASGKRLVGATPPEQFIEELERGGRPARTQR